MMTAASSTTATTATLAHPAATRALPPPPWRQAGFWMAVLIAALMYLNAVRTVVNPIGFADTMGLVLQAGADVSWVRVYGLRALLIGLIVTYLLVRQDPGTLSWLALFGAVVALGDAWLVSNADGATVPRHLSIAVFLVVATLALRRWQRKLAAPSMQRAQPA
jgi:uncharacterized membrane protein (DUF485 family)